MLKLMLDIIQKKIWWLLSIEVEYVNYLLGTQDFINWYNNIKFFKHDFGDCSNCKVHLGFWETYDDVSAEVL